jgi:hypothetical protein
MVSNMTDETIQDEVTEESEVEVEDTANVSEDAATLSPVQEDVVADVVNIQQGGAQNVRADKVTVSQGGIAHAESRFIDVTEGGIAVAMGENVTISGGGAAVVAADNVKMSESVAVFVAANTISGDNVKILVDVRAAAFFALIFGAITGVLKLLMRRREG